MKPTYLLFGICLTYLFIACKPDFDLNAPYKDVTVVYGVLNHQDSIHYVKIYKGFQSHKQGGVFIDAQNKDSIYYYDQITAVLQELDKDNKWVKDIPLYITNTPSTFPRDSGFFYYGEDRILYYTTEPLLKGKTYNIKITHNTSGKITEGKTPILGNGTGPYPFEIESTSQIFPMLGASRTINFWPAADAKDYELHVSFVYFEVDKETGKTETYRIVKNITPTVGTDIPFNKESGYYSKQFPLTFYDDIATNVKPNPKVTRYMGTPSSPGLGIEVYAWAAGESMINFILSNKPTSSFVQINTKYTNLTSSDGLAFGFLSSRVKSPTKRFTTNKMSEDTLVKGPKTGDLGFRYWIEYKP